MPIASPIGFLDVVNATLRASQVETTSRLTVANTAATKNFSVGDRFHVDKDSVDPVSVTGNVVASGIKISNLTISPIFDLGAVSNVGNTTSNTLQFANATTSFVASSNVEIGGNITLTSNAQVKVGSNVLAEYTGPHGREPKEMPLKKFPEILFEDGKFDSNPTTNTYTQAGYTVTASSSAFEENGFAPWKVFNQDNGKTGNNGWHTAGNPAAVSGSPYNTIDSSYVGEWLKIELPKAIKLSHVSIASRNDYASRQPPSKYRVYGSNNDSNWVQLIDADNVVYAEEVFTTKFSTTTNYYKYLALVIQKGTIDTAVTIGEIQYYGTEEPAPPGDLSLDTTLKSTFNSVRSNNYVMYFDGDGFIPDDNTSNNLVDNKSVIHHNATYDSTGKYWTLDGSTESNVTTGSLGLVGDTPHTVSTWINASNLEANATTQQLFSIGSGYDKAFLKVDDTQIAANTWHNVTYAYQGEGGSKVTYVDGRKVEEAQVEDTFGAYPPFAMTGYKTSGYCVSASSDDYNANGFYAYKAFNDVQGDEGWHGGVGNGTTLHFTANAGGSVYDASISGGTSSPLSGNVGEWIKLEMPHKLVVGYVNVKSRGTSTPSTQSPKDFKILGSNDDINWDILESFTSVPYAITGQNHAVGATKGYKYIAFLVTRIQRTDTAAVVIGELKFYGHKEGDLTRFPEPTRALKYPHIAMTGPAQRGYVASASSENDGTTQGFAYLAFDGVAGGTRGYHSSSGVYSSGVYQGTAKLTGPGSVDYDGEWIKLELPHKIKVTGVSFAPRTSDPNYFHRIPHKGYILGSNTGSDGSWELVHSFDNVTTTEGVTKKIDFTGTNASYKYIAMVAEEVGLNATYGDVLNFSEMEFFGTQEDTQTPAIVGGPFAGKVANFRVYDKYLGEERIQEIYDAQKDEFGHKKSSMTFYKGRIGVGTTEPEGALTVVDEPHALEKFPARAVSADESYDEGIGHIKLSSAESSTTGTRPPVSVRSSGSNYATYPGYVSGDYMSPSGFVFNAFDGLTSTSWTATPTRNTRLSEEVDFGAWLKIQTPESMSLKKAEIESKPDWRQVGGTFQGVGVGHQLGDTVACNKDGTRIAIAETASGGTITAPQDGRVRIYDWNGSAWTQVGQNLTGAQSDYYGAGNMGFSDDGHRFITSSPNDGTSGGGTPNAGVVEVYYLSGSTWTILGTPFTSSDGGAQVGKSCAISGDGNTIAFVEYQYDDTNVGVNAGRTRVFTWNGTTWVQKGSDMIGDVSGDGMGRVMEMTGDGNYIIIGNYSASSNNGKVWIYAWNGSAWVKRGNTLVGTGADLLGFDVTISDDANTIAIGENHNDDKGTEAGAVEIRTWNGSAYVLTQTLYDAEETTGRFGSAVALSGDGTRLVAVTHHSPDGSGSAHGRARVFEYYGGSWQLRQPFTSIGAQGNAGTDGSGSALGQEDGLAVSRDGSVIVVGLKNDDTSGNANSGQAKVFNMPSNIKSIWGSNDDVNWTKITTGNETFRGNDHLEFKNLDNPNYYKYHAIVADAFTQLKDVKLFGVRNQGSSTLHDGTLTLTKNLDVPRIGPPLDADDTPRRDRLVVEYNTSTNPMEDGLVQDTSGKGNDGVMIGSSYSTDKSLSFTNSPTGTSSAATSYITRQSLGNKESGNFHHSVSLWFKMTTGVSSAYRAIFEIGPNPRVNGKDIGLYVSSNSATPFSFASGGTSLLSSGSALAGQVYHIVIVYDGAKKYIYIDGVLNNSAAYTSFNGVQNMTMQIGRNNHANANEGIDGSISNFKMYVGHALEPSEVKTLYDMGRCSNAIPKTLHIMGGMMRYNNDIGKLQIHNGARWSTIGGIKASGGTRSTFGDYALHVFTESGTFSIDNNEGGYVDILIVAGGGSGGGASNGGGGGAGGVLFAQNYFLSGGNYTATVGAGAAATNAQGGNGGDSSFSRINATAKGGGAGGDYRSAGGSGGSGGGGGAGDQNALIGGGGVVGSTPSGFTKYGNSGGASQNGTSSGRAGAGGGGAGGAGTWANGNLAGSGGLGIDLSAIFGTNVGESGYFASGGGGQSRTNINLTWPGPLGGGGANNGNRAGLPNTGGGSHGGVGGLQINPGGSGVIIVRYLV